jgi:general secretion pathway protein E
MVSSRQDPDILSYRDYPKEPVEIENISLEFMKKSCFVPIAITDRTFEIAMADPRDFNTIAALKFAYGLEVKVKKGNTDDILDAIERLYGTGRQSMETIIEEAGRDMANCGRGGNRCQ